ncbi:single-stranded-DNA-specific exonuclease RecJ, partial [bacterium (Candidatus Howlettbacteria) CG_4_10_14_0_8_um_filter_40_9]
PRIRTIYIWYNGSMKIEWKKEIKDTENISNSEIVHILLKNRGVKDEKSFLHPPHPSLLTFTDFKLKAEFAKAVELLGEIRERKQMIVVYTDYDADGITGGTIVWETLNLLGFHVMPYVPHRKHEGYGFSIKGIDNVIKEFNPALIISVDHGISARKQIAYADSRGVKIIVTDHHLKPEDPPDKTYATFHIPELSGSGVGYLFAKEIFEYFKKNNSVGTGRDLSLHNNFKSDYLTLASIGTIADLVPLVGPSRSIVYYGLAAFAKVKRTGIRHIIKQAGIEEKIITPYEIGFVIAPRINAVGRLEHAIDALRLLCTTSDEKAKALASRIGSTNKKRQDLVVVAVKEAVEQVEKKLAGNKKLPPLLILCNPDWNEGIIGLIASKITEKYNRPAIAMTKSDGYWKGSARSFNDFHITDFLRTESEMLHGVGGHKLAAGFSVEEKKKDLLIKKLETKAKKILKEKNLERIISADLCIPLSKVHMSLAKDMEVLAPFGMGNPYPKFVSMVTVLEIKLFGKKYEHVKLLVKDSKTYSFPLEMIAFHKAEEYKIIEKGQTLQVVYELDINRWNGRESLRGKIITIQLRNI